MGSFNQTCAVTHTAIEDDDPVVAFFLARAYGYNRDSMEGYVGSASIWQPISLPFEGTYADYGSIAPGEHALADRLLKPIAGHSIEGLLEIGQEGETHGVDLGHPYGKSDLKLMLVHREVFEKLSARTTTPYGRDIDASAEGGRVLDFIDTIKAAHAESWARTHPTIPQFDAYGSLSEATQVWSTHTGLPWTQTPYVERFFAGGVDDVHPVLRQATRKALESAHKEGDRALTEEILRGALDTAVFANNMTLLRRMWTPQVGMGSQDVESGLHSEIAQWTVALCRRREHEFDGDDEPDASSPAP